MQGLRSASTASTKHRNTGFTLIEVIAGLTLLATLGGAVLLAVSKHHRQVSLAQHRMQAAEVAEKMMAVWHKGAEGLPLRGGGRLLPPGKTSGETWQWRIAPIDQRNVTGQPVHVMRFEILQESVVLCSLELLRPIPLPPKPEAT